MTEAARRQRRRAMHTRRGATRLSLLLLRYVYALAALIPWALDSGGASPAPDLAEPRAYLPRRAGPLCVLLREQRILPRLRGGSDWIG